MCGMFSSNFMITSLEGLPGPSIVGAMSGKAVVITNEDVMLHDLAGSSVGSCDYRSATQGGGMRNGLDSIS